MIFPKFTLRFLFLVLFSILAVTSVGPATSASDSGAVPQRLRVRVESQRLRTGQVTKVVVEFLDRNYGQVVNDATREIVLGQVSAGSKTTSSGAGRFNTQKIVVKPGSWYGEAWFTSSGVGRLFITAASDGLESGRALILITSDKSVSLLNRFFSMFETVAHAQDESLGFEIFPKVVTATADGRHRAIFNVSFLKNVAAGTIVRITTNLTNGGIFYKGERVGGTVADIKLNEGEDISGEIAVYSAQNGKFQVNASVRPNGPTDQAKVEFTRPLPTQIIFDDEPTTMGTDPTHIPITVRLADDGGFPIEPDRERTIRFSRATESAQVKFETESVVIKPGQPYAQVKFQLEQLPPGNELKLHAESDGLRLGQKTLVIKSVIEKLLITGPNEVYCSGEECEFTIYLIDKDDKHQAADWDRHIELNVNGGVLSAGQLVIPKGKTKGTIRYSPAHDIGKYVLTATSLGIADGTYPIGVIYKAYLLTIFALLGGLVGGIGRQLKADPKFTNIFPHRVGKKWEWGCVGRLVGSVIAAFFLYWAFKLGLSQAFSSPVLPASLDMGTKIVAFFFGGIGGFAGIVVLELLAGWLLPGTKKQTAPAQ